MATEKQNQRAAAGHSKVGQQPWVAVRTQSRNTVSAPPGSCAQKSVGIRQREFLSRLPDSEPHRVRVGWGDRSADEVFAAYLHKDLSLILRTNVWGKQTSQAW